MPSILNYYCQFYSFLFYSILEKIRSTLICLFSVFGNLPGLQASSTGSDAVITFTRSFISFRAARCCVTVFSPILGIHSFYAFLVQIPSFSGGKKKSRVHTFEKFCFLFGTHEHYNISPKQNSLSLERVLSTFSL